MYSIEGDQNGFFRINPKNGDLQTAKIIDRESLVSIYFRIIPDVNEGAAIYTCVSPLPVIFQLQGLQKLYESKLFFQNKP